MKKTLLVLFWQQACCHFWSHAPFLWAKRLVLCTLLIGFLLPAFVFPIQTEAQSNFSNDTIMVVGKRNLSNDSYAFTVTESLKSPEIEIGKIDPLTYEQELVIPVNVSSDSPLDCLEIWIDGALKYDLNAIRNGKARGVALDIIDFNKKIVEIAVYEGEIKLKFADYEEAVHQIKIVASNKNASSATEIIETWEWKNPCRQPQLFTLSMGVSDYLYIDTIGGVMDANRFYEEVIKKSMGLYYEKGHHIPLRNETFNKQRIEDIVQNKKGLEGIGTEDILVVYYAGHGLYRLNEETGKGKTYLKPYDYPKSNDDYAKGIVLEDDIIKPLEDNIGCKIIVFIDACQSLGSPRGRGTPSFKTSVTESSPDFSHLRIGENAFQDYSDYLVRDSNSTILFFAASPGQRAREDDNSGRGDFTTYIINAFAGGADYGIDGLIFPSALDYYLKTQYYLFNQSPRSEGIFYKSNASRFSAKAECKYIITESVKDTETSLVSKGNDIYTPIPGNIPSHKDIEIFLGVDYPLGKVNKTITTYTTTPSADE